MITSVAYACTALLASPLGSVCTTSSLILAENLAAPRGAMSLDQYSAQRLCSDESLTHRAAPLTATLYRLRQKVPPCLRIWGAGQGMSQCHVRAKQKVGTVPQAIQQPTRGDFILNIYSPTNHSAFPWFPRIMPIETPTLLVLFLSVTCSHSEQNCFCFSFSSNTLGQFYICREWELMQIKYFCFEMPVSFFFFKHGFWPTLAKYLHRRSLNRSDTYNVTCFLMFPSTISFHLLSTLILLSFLFWSFYKLESRIHVSDGGDICASQPLESLGTQGK